MVIQVHFDIDRTSYTYEVEPRVDGLFIAKLQPPKWGGYILISSPKRSTYTAHLRAGKATTTEAILYKP